MNARSLIELTLDGLEAALEDHPEDATDMDLVSFAIDHYVGEEETVTEAEWSWAQSEAFRACALGLLQTMKAVSP